MKTPLRYIATCLLMLTVLAGCSKKELYTHEELYKSSTSLKIDRSGGSPTASTVRMRVWSADEAVDTTFIMDAGATVRLELEEREYTFVGTQDAAHIRFDGEYFRLEQDADGLFLEPEDFSAGIGTFVPAAQQENLYTLRLLPFTRELALRFSLSCEADGRIASIHARLSGMASARRLHDHATTSGAGGTIELPIERESASVTRAGNERVFYSGVRNLLGVHTAQQQLLSLNLRYTNGEEETLQQDLTPYLRDFNDYASGPVEALTLNAEITIAGQPGVSAVIGDWKQGTDSDLDATDEGE